MSAGRRKGINNHIKRGLAAYLERQEVTGLLEAVKPREAPVRYALEVLTAICGSLPPDTDTPAMRVTLGDARHVWDVLTKKLTDREVPDMPEVPEVCSPLACLPVLTSQGRGVTGEERGGGSLTWLREGPRLRCVCQGGGGYGTG